MLHITLLDLHIKQSSSIQYNICKEQPKYDVYYASVNDSRNTGSAKAD